MSAPHADVNGEFVERSVDVDGTTHRYQVFVPASRAGGTQPPVILFLHGSGERGSDNHTQLEVGLGPYVRRHAAGLPGDRGVPAGARGQRMDQDAGAHRARALDAATREFDGDPDRIVPHRHVDGRLRRLGLALRHRTASPRWCRCAAASRVDWA